MKTIVTIYEKPTCSTCRAALATADEHGIEYREVNYYETPLSHAKLKELLGKMGMQARELLRTKEAVYKELGLAEKDLSEDELIDLMIAHPDLMQRPIIERGDKAILGRPVEKAAEFLKA